MGVKAWLCAGLLAMPLAAAATPVIQHWTLANGTRVYFVETHDLPMVQLRAVFDAGSSRDPEGKQGLAAMTGALLAQGSGELDADEIAERFESIGAEFSTGSDREMAIANLRSLSDPQLFKPAVDLLSRVLREPVFTGESLSRERARFLVALRAEAQSPAQIADKTFYQLLFGKHPYASHHAGTEEGLKALVREDLLDHHRRFYVGANAVLAMIGDLSSRQARQLSERVMGGLPMGAKAPPIPVTPEVEQPGERLISFPSTQSHIRMGVPGLKRLDPDYFPLHVGNYILGGSGLVSRLAEIIREKNGLSYSVYSYFYPMRERGPYIMGLQTKNSQRQRALDLMRRTVADFIAEGPTEDEIIAAKKHLTGGFPLRIDNNSKIAEYLAVIGFYGLPLTYLDDYIPSVEAVTIDQIRDAFRRRVQLENMVTVIVGGGDQ